jgi:hypothetical protein
LIDDNEACPTELAYAVEASACVNFKITVNTEDLWSAEARTAYSDEMTTKINAGELYGTVKTNYPNTFIYGLGSPGAGGETTGATAAPGETANTSTSVKDTVVEEPALAPAPEPTGLGTVAIVLIILALIIVPVAIIAGYSQYSKAQKKDRVERIRRYESTRAIQGGDDNELYNPDGSSKAGSSLAAMSAAGTAVAMSRNIPSE